MRVLLMMFVGEEPFYRICLPEKRDGFQEVISWKRERAEPSPELAGSG